MNTLIAVLAFILTLGILITIHEWGHFFVAKKLGVKVLRFSVGFGKPLWRHQSRAGTEYCIAAIPLGGYVKMLDEREGVVPEEELPYAFNRQSVWARIAIVLAGPVANFIFAIAAFALVYGIGTRDFAPIVDTVTPDSIAYQIGIRAGDEIVAVDGITTINQQAIRRTFLTEKKESYMLTLKRQDAQVTLELPSSALPAPAMDPQFFTALGLNLAVPAIIGEVMPHSPAALAGLQSGDEVLQLNQQPVGNWVDFVNELANYPGQTIPLTIKRNGEMIDLTLTPETRTEQGKTHGYIGVMVNDKLLRLDRAHVGSALLQGMRDTWLYSELTFVSIGHMFMGAGMKEVSGPISIAIYAGQTAQMGLVYFLQFLALISISLGVINLLPIPMLDGGHLLYYAIELVWRRPLSLKVQQIGLGIGLVVLISLMTLAFYNDITLLGSR